MLLICGTQALAPSMMVSCLPISFSGLLHPKLDGFRFSNDVHLRPGNGMKVPYLFANNSGYTHAISKGRSYQQFGVKDESVAEPPFWISLIKETIWSVRSLVTFLVEQPSQLKHIEWPSFKSTLKTATLTLVLVAVLIVALSSVDSILCYLLALFLRKAL